MIQHSECVSVTELNSTEWFTVPYPDTLGSDGTCWYAAHWSEWIIVPSCMCAWMMGSRVAAVRSGTIAYVPELVSGMCPPSQTPKSRSREPFHNDTVEEENVHYKWKKHFMCQMFLACGLWRYKDSSICTTPLVPLIVWCVVAKKSSHLEDVRADPAKHRI